MNKNKAIEYIKRAKEQLSYDLLTIRLCEMARNNLQKALKELETESPRKGEGVPVQILSEEKSSSKERKEDNAESRYR